MNKINNFTTIDTIYGKWIVSRHAQYHAENLIKTGVPIHPKEAQFMIELTKTFSNNCIIVDVGSNAGIFSVPLATEVKSKGGKVYSFEVQKSLAYALSGTAVLNDLDNLTVFNCGIGATQHTLKMPNVDYSQSVDYGIVTLVNQESINSTETIEIYPLDSFEFERLDFLKIDIEGMEIEALDGGSKTIKKHRPWMFIEFWNVDKEKLKSWFTGLNYTLYQPDGANILCCPNEKVVAAGLTFNFQLF
jgi:FkbM family methyltransferase